MKECEHCSIPGHSRVWHGEYEWNNPVTGCKDPNLPLNVLARDFGAGIVNGYAVARKVIECLNANDMKIVPADTK